EKWSTRMAHGVQTYYNTPEVLTHYKEYEALDPVESLLLARFRDELQDQPLLDVGIGGGRTTPYLLQISKSYIGVDFSAGMVGSAREKFPEANLQVCDASDLSRFGNGQFAAVFFLGAGLDDVPVAGRPRVLKEVNRVLRSRGAFLLAAHNFDAHDLRF